MANDLSDPVGGLKLFFVERHEGMHSLYIRLHHLHASHTRKHHKDLGEACRISQGVGDRRGITESFKLGNSGRRKVHQSSSLDRLHDDHLSAVLYGNVVALLALNSGIVVIKIVYLKLNCLYLGLLGQDLVKYIRRVVERHCYMLDLSLSVMLVHRFKRLAALMLFIRVSVERMEKIKIKIFNSAYLKLLLKERTNLLLGLEKPIRKLVCQNVLTSVVTLCQAFSDCLFALTVYISVRCVKIVKSRGNKGVYHTVDLGGVHLSVLHRQAHTAKAKVSLDLLKHIVLLRF